MPSSIKGIKDQIITQWRDNYSETETEYTNLDFKKDRTEPFVRLSIQFGKAFSILKGAGSITRHTGLIHVTIRTPVLSGTNRAYELADIAADILERKRLGTVTTRQSALYEVGVEDEYFTLVLSVPFLDN